MEVRPGKRCERFPIKANGMSSRQVGDWRAMTERANVRKASSGATTFFTAIVSIGVLLLVVFGGVYGVPYLYNRTTKPIAGAASNPNSLNGTWTGKVQIVGKVDFDEFSRKGGQGVPPDPIPKPAAVRLTASTVMGWGVPKFKGVVEVCDATGTHYAAHYDNEAILAPSSWTVVLRNMNGPQMTQLRGNFVPGQLSIHWEYSPGQTITGVLVKSPALSFQQLCDHL
jgi:hypothetical protein